MVTGPLVGPAEDDSWLLEGVGEAQCAHCCLQGVQFADNTRQGNINVSFSCSLHKDLSKDVRLGGLFIQLV